MPLHPARARGDVARMGCSHTLLTSHAPRSIEFGAKKKGRCSMRHCLSRIMRAWALNRRDTLSTITVLRVSHEVEVLRKLKLTRELRVCDVEAVSVYIARMSSEVLSPQFWPRGTRIISTNTSTVNAPLHVLNREVPDYRSGTYRYPSIMASQVLARSW